jgi:alkanesulfonate monooxygenase SsuD/methylene tetrahydromethanopterin reductase-like flavin-dependent oxidoreductase (luciferase family)
MKTDLVLAPFGASAREAIAAARAADAGGFDAVWTYDHFSGLVQGAPWSRDPFVTLAAIAVTTERINVGVLVANVANRHPAQLACAANSMQSLAPGRVLLGVGAGTAATSEWSAESTAIGRPVADAATRRAVLAETIDALRAIWSGAPYPGHHVQVAAAIAVTDGSPVPPIIVGAGSRETIRVACEHADGVNILPGADLAGRVAFAREHATASPFEVSVFSPLDVTHPLGGAPTELVELGVDRRTLYVGAPYPLDPIGTIAANLRSWNPASG